MFVSELSSNEISNVVGWNERKMLTCSISSDGDKNNKIIRNLCSHTSEMEFVDYDDISTYRKFMSSDNKVFNMIYSDTLIGIFPFSN